MTASGNGRGRKPKPGRITFVGSGPGDPGLLTTRARTVLANATCVFTDPDVPAAVLNVVGSALGPAVGPAPAPSGGADGADPTEQTVEAGPDIRPALGEPAEVSKIWLA
jgi:uroporphyrinogen III methyltransferase/synthase